MPLPEIKEHLLESIRENQDGITPLELSASECGNLARFIETALANENLQLLHQIKEAAWALSTWAGCINWNTRETNQQPFLDGLEDRINHVQRLYKQISVPPPGSMEMECPNQHAKTSHPATVLSDSDWREIYYALLDKQSIVEGGDMETDQIDEDDAPFHGGDRGAWAEHLNEIIGKIGPDGEAMCGHGSQATEIASARPALGLLDAVTKIRDIAEDLEEVCNHEDEHHKRCETALTEIAAIARDGVVNAANTQSSSPDATLMGLVKEMIAELDDKVDPDAEAGSIAEFEHDWHTRACKAVYTRGRPAASNPAPSARERN